MAAREDGSPGTRFLNVDLDIFSRSDLQPLVTSLGAKVIVLYVGKDRRRYCARLELARIMKSADSTIRAFCRLIQSLPESGRDLWNAAIAREFNIGVQAGRQPHSCDFVLAAETVQAVSDVGARILFTVYAPEESIKPND